MTRREKIILIRNVEKICGQIEYTQHLASKYGVPDNGNYLEEAKTRAMNLLRKIEEE